MLPLRRYYWRVLPIILLIALYWPGLTNWFYQDDFGWLNLRHDVHSLADLGPALFAPKAHGNLRPLGENAYFLVLSSLFGVDPLPFRIWAFLTQIASLILLGSLARRLTGSPAAAFWAQILWIVNTGLAPAMCWTSIYNQILSGFFLLLALWFFLRYIDGGRTRDAVGHWAAFILGLGALETNVVYPALAAVYALLFARTYLKKVLPMFAVSALFVWVHFRVAPIPHTGVYALHPDQAFSTLATYWMWALGPSRPIAAILTAALLALLLWSIRARHWVPLFGLAWFVIVLGPYLPLSEHTMDYYLAVPVIGLALAGGAALAYAWRSSWIWKTAASSCVALYLAVSLPAAWSIARWHHDRGARVADLLLGVAEIHDGQPSKMILLDGIDSDLFWSGIADAPFRAMEIPHVYLAPGSESRIQAPPNLAMKYTLPPALALPALRDGRAVVYQFDGTVLRNITSGYRAAAESSGQPEMPRFINLGDSAFDPYIGAGWDAPAGGFRLLRTTGAARIAGPRSRADRLYINVFRGVRLAVSVNGVDQPAVVAQRNTDSTEFAIQLPAAFIGAPRLDLTLSNQSPAPLRFGFLEIR